MGISAQSTPSQDRAGGHGRPVGRGPIINSTWAPLAQAMPVLIVWACFGPFISRQIGVRAEHLLIYLSFPVALLALAARPQALASFWPLVLIRFNVLFVTLWCLASTFLGPHHYRSLGGVIGRAQNDVQAFAVLTIMIAFLAGLGAARVSLLFRRACWTIIGLLVANAGVALLGLVSSALPALLFRYWQPPASALTGGGSVMANALGMGRLLGVFNQPVESGIAYVLGLLLLGYVTRHKPRFGVLEYVLLLALGAGGMLSVSKVFILGAPVVFLVYLKLAGKLRQVINPGLAIAAVVGAVGVSVLFMHWSGSAYLLRLFHLDSSPDLLNLFTAGRFQAGGEGQTVYGFREVWRQSPVFGLGYDVRGLAMDNAWMEFFMQGGIVGLVSYSLILWGIGLSCWHAYRLRTAEAPLLAGLLLLIVGGGLGGPVLTMNRCGTLIWVTLGFIWVLTCARQTVQGSPGAPSRQSSAEDPCAQGG